jgi:kelch-like protein 10
MILNTDELNVKSEEAVFDAVIRWIDYKVDERKQVGIRNRNISPIFLLKNIIDLLKCVRLGLLTTNFFLEKVKCHPYIINNDACKPLVIETLKYLYELDLDTHQVCLWSSLFLGEIISFSKDLLVQNPIARPRIPHEILFVCGGWSGGSPTSAIELYDVSILSNNKNKDFEI